MATLISRELEDWMADVTDFVRENISEGKKLHQLNIVPKDLWQKMGERGLLGQSISAEYGGLGKKAIDISASSFVMAKEGGNLGICLSFLIHQLVSHFIVEKMGTEDHKKKYLPDMAAGRTTACLAVSEPNTFAHPKHIKTMAEKIPSGYVINGEKTYLTNGPIADYFIVVAVTEIVAERKRFSAFIVPKHTPGLTVTSLSLPFFKPAPHGAIRLENCEVSDSALIGRTGSAYEDIVLKFRGFEDALMMGSVAGAIERLAELLTDALRMKLPVSGSSLDLDLGKLKAMLDTARIIAWESAAMVDSGAGHREKMSLHLFFRDLVKDILVLIQMILKSTGVEPGRFFKIISDDLTASSRIGGQVAELKQMKIGNLFFSHHGEQ